MTSNWASPVLAAVGTLAVLAGASVRLLGVDVPEYAISIGEGPIDVYADEGAGTESRLRRRFDLFVTNSGRRPFRIQQVQPKCSCTVAGELPAEPIAPGARAAIPLELHFPAYGAKSTTLTVLTDAPKIPLTEVTLRLHGPKISAPFIETVFTPVQLTAEAPGDLVEYQFEATTLEKLNEEAWLTGMSSSYSNSSVELMSVDTVDKIDKVGLARRRYVFLLTLIGPELKDRPVAFTLDPVSRTPPSRESPPPRFRCTLTPGDGRQ